MGCASSSSGHIINTRESGVKLQQILATSNQKTESVANGRIYLFGQTRTQRKIIQCETKTNSLKCISNKTRIPCPKIHQDPLEILYEQSQQLFHLGTYGFSLLPPFNKMLALYLQSTVIFMCGGRDYDNYNVKNQTFFYSAQDNKIMSEITSLNQLNARPETRPKYARSRFQKMASMKRKRHSHMGIYSYKLKSVLVFGGINEKNETLASCQIYNILQNTWRDLPAMKVPRADGHCFEYENKVYLFGGRSSILKLSKKIQVFSLQQLTWTVLKFQIHRGIENALVFSQAPNQLLIVGGSTHFYNCKTVIKIDVKQQTYMWDSQLNKEYKYTKGVKMGQELLIFGGQKDTCQIFSKKRWKVGLLSHRKIVEIDELQDFSFTQQSLVIKSSESTSSKLQACSQEESVFFGTDDYPCVIFYNKNAGIIQKCSVPMQLRLKKNMQVVQLPNKMYMLLGGCDRQEKKISRSCFIYNARENKARQSLKMTDKKINFAAVYFQSQLYIFGGFNPAENSGQISCQKFNFEQQKWIQLRRLNKPRYKTFAQKIGENKIAVFGKQYKNTPVTQIQIYYTKRDYYDKFGLTVSIPDQISMVYAAAQQNKVIILRQDESNNIEDIEITEQKLIEKELQKTARILEQQMDNIIIHSTENQEHQEPHQMPQIKYKEHFESQYESSELHRNSMIAKKPKLIEIKPVQCESLDERVQEQLEDSSFQVEKIGQFNKTINDSLQSGFKQLKTSQKQMPQISNFQDDNRFSLNHSFEANLSPVRYKRSITERKYSQTRNVKNTEDISIKLSEKYSAKQLEGISRQKHKIIKRQNQLYFFNQNQVTHFDILTNERRKHKIENQDELKLLHIQ